MKRFWDRLDRSSRIALVVGVVLGYSFPDRDVRVGVLVAVPILSVAFLVGLLRGFGATVLIVFLGCSLILPVALARLGANARRGPDRD